MPTDLSFLVDIINTGGVVGFAWLVLRWLDKISKEFQEHSSQRDEQIETMVKNFELAVRDRDSQMVEMIKQFQSHIDRREESHIQMIEFYRADSQSTVARLEQMSATYAHISSSLEQLRREMVIVCGLEKTKYGSQMGGEADRTPEQK